MLMVYSNFCSFFLAYELVYLCQPIVREKGWHLYCENQGRGSIYCERDGVSPTVRKRESIYREKEGYHLL